jgi:hypothetical protein
MQGRRNEVPAFKLDGISLNRQSRLRGVGRLIGLIGRMSWCAWRFQPFPTCDQIMALPQSRAESYKSKTSRLRAPCNTLHGHHLRKELEAE